MTDKVENDERESQDIQEEAPVVTAHQLELAGATLAYTATVGKLPLKDERGKIAAQIFYTAYTVEADDSAERPLIFVFNGGPGSASIWLHMGALGPKRVDMGAEGFMPPPPYRLIDNAHTWLDLGDLVFIDPVGNRFIRAPLTRTTTRSIGGWRRTPGSGWRVHPPLPLAGAALDIAALPGWRKLWHDQGGGLGGTSYRARHRLQRHLAAFDRDELPDAALHQRQ